jgi:flavin-binding protein dodecin
MHRPAASRLFSAGGPVEMSGDRPFKQTASTASKLSLETSNHHIDDASVPVKLAFRVRHGCSGRVFNTRRRDAMSVAKVSEISATSPKSFEDAIQQGLTRASKTLRNLRGAWVKEQHVRCENGKITEYQVNMMVTFILDD